MKQVFVYNNRRILLKISGVQVNAEQVKVRTVEDLAGKQFRIILEFRAEFQIPDRKEVMLSYKTNHPSAPSFTVPIAKGSLQKSFPLKSKLEPR